MKITRHNYDEDYNVTADWLKDFADQFSKKSYNIENATSIRNIVEDKKVFATIEEKMADIKKRIGFDEIEKLHKQSDAKTASHKCKCGLDCSCSVKTASKEHSQEDLDAMSCILKYIKDLVHHEHQNLTPIMVISRCREEPGLNFENLPIDMDKLENYTKKLLSKYNKKPETVKYMPLDDAVNNFDSNPEAEYWSHAFPQR